MSSWGKIGFILLVVCLFFAFPQYCLSAEEEQLLFFSEIAWRGSSVSPSDEWVELSNPTNKIIDLHGYKIIDLVGNKEILQIDQGQIAPRGNFLIANSSKDHLYSSNGAQKESALNLNPDIVCPSLSLSNSKFAIALVDASGLEIDFAGNGSKPFFGEYDKNFATMVRVEPISDGRDISAWAVARERKNFDFGITDYGTPQNSGRIVINNFKVSDNLVQLFQNTNIKYELSIDIGNNVKNKNFIEVFENDKLILQKEIFLNQGYIQYSIGGICPIIKIKAVSDLGLESYSVANLSCYQLSNNIRFTEIEPTPQQDFNGDGIADSRDEWIEIANFSLDEECYLGGWQIQDASGKKYFFEKNVIGKGQYVVLTKLLSKISINDSGEKLLLIDPVGNISDEVIIPSHQSKIETSYARWGDTWSFSQISTPNAENIIVQDTETKNIEDIEKVNRSNGARVNFYGRVVEQDRDNIAILQRNSGNLVTLKKDKDYQNISNGSVVEGSGYLYLGNNLFVNLDSLQLSEVRNSSEFADKTEGTDIALTSNTYILQSVIEKKKNQIIFNERVKGLSFSSQSNSKGFKSARNLLYFLGIFNILSLVGIYGIYCRE